MITSRKESVAIFVDRASQQWIVRDPDGQFWIISSTAENPWDNRQPFQPAEDMELEPVPRHYRYLLRLPF
jgi:hypothetical protein